MKKTKKGGMFKQKPHPPPQNNFVSLREFAIDKMGERKRAKERTQKNEENQNRKKKEKKEREKQEIITAMEEIQKEHNLSFNNQMSQDSETLQLKGRHKLYYISMFNENVTILNNGKKNLHVKVTLSEYEYAWYLLALKTKRSNPVIEVIVEGSAGGQWHGEYDNRKWKYYVRPLINNIRGTECYLVQEYKYVKPENFKIVEPEIVEIENVEAKNVKPKNNLK